MRGSPRAPARSAYGSSIAAVCDSIDAVGHELDGAGLEQRIVRIFRAQLIECVELVGREMSAAADSAA